jgi:hypothetical protein
MVDPLTATPTASTPVLSSSVLMYIYIYSDWSRRILGSRHVVEAKTSARHRKHVSGSAWRNKACQNLVYLPHWHWRTQDVSSRVFCSVGLVRPGPVRQTNRPRGRGMAADRGHQAGENHRLLIHSSSRIPGIAQGLLIVAALCRKP